MLLIYDDFFQKHDTGNLHPENAGRIYAIKQSIDKNITTDSVLKNHLEFRTPQKAKLNHLYSVHKESYVNRVKEISLSGSLYYLDPDTVVSKYTYECAALAAGACITGIDYLMDEPANNKYCNKNSGFLKTFFALVRPPGHHAFSSKGSGFCIFNNIAIAAKYALNNYNTKKIAIIDFDAHHGNGTQSLFYYDDDVFYISLHQYPHYPGSGYWDETGEKKGKGFNLNIPLESFSEEYDYIVAFTDIIIPILAGYCPELILVSAGFDAHVDDPLSSIKLYDRSYYNIMKLLLFLRSICSLKLSSSSACNIGIVLEGGYDCGATARSAIEVIKACVEEENAEEEKVFPKKRIRAGSDIKIENGPKDVYAGSIDKDYRQISKNEGKISIAGQAAYATAYDMQMRTLSRLKEHFLSCIKNTGGPGKNNSLAFKNIREIFGKSFKVFPMLCMVILCFFMMAPFSGCRQYDNKMDISYFFKTSPEQSVIDFIYAMSNHDAGYIYSNLLLESDRRNISRDKFTREMSEILSDIENISIERIVYLGYEDNMSKVVIEFNVIYKNGDEGKYKKYIYLVEENGKWKIVFDKTFI